MLKAVFAGGLLWAAPVWAQCSMCRTAAASQGAHGMHTMNTAIVVLLVPAVALFCGMFVLALRGDAPPGLEDPRDDPRVEP